MIPQWPIREPAQAVEIVASAITSTHIVERTEDGVICIRRNEQRDASQDPEIMQETEGMANYSILNQEVIDALLSVLPRAIAS
jgi:hypothetical protein